MRKVSRRRPRRGGGRRRPKRHAPQLEVSPPYSPPSKRVPGMTLCADLGGKVRGMRVMVVEDFEDTREMLKLMLELKGCEVLEAADGREAVERALGDGLNLILMDLNLPVMSGYEATREIVSSPRTSHIPVVALSAQCSGERRQRALDAGCLECLDKPINMPALDEVLHRYAAA